MYPPDGQPSSVCDNFAEDPCSSHENIEEGTHSLNVANCSQLNEVSLTTDPCEATEERCATWLANNQSTEKTDVQFNMPMSDETTSLSDSGTTNVTSQAESEIWVKTTSVNKEQDKQNVDGQEPQQDVINKKEGPRKSTINENASPFYPSGYLSPTSSMFIQHSSGNPPTLYLYTPGAQSIVPCDEIVITSPIIAPDGTTLYPNPSNVYLPFDGMINSMQYLGPQVTPSGLIQYDQVLRLP